MTDDTDIKLCYFGGSGGFIVLHLLLCSGKFFCQFQDDSINLREIINKQWQISEPRLWKMNEYWPDNLETQKSKTDLRKIYFFCNPKIDEISKFDGQIFFLYLDLNSHIEMCEYKHAFKFYNESTSSYKSYFSYYRSQLKYWVEHYNNLKDPSWPRCTGPAGFLALPRYIQQELLQNSYTSILLDIKKYVHINYKDRNNKIERLRSNKSMTDDGTWVMPEVLEFLMHADLSLKLTDIINDLDLLCKVTKTPTNQDQVDLRNKWVALHPSSLLNNTGIKFTLE